MRKSIVALALVIAVHAYIVPVGVASANYQSTDSTASTFFDYSSSTPAFALKKPAEAPKTLHLKITAYSSAVDETDSTPNLTAMGTKTRYGVVATNILPFNTKIKIPSLFGDEIFTVEDRMNARMKNALDIWMPTKSAAFRFGVAHADVVIMDDVSPSFADLAINYTD